MYAGNILTWDRAAVSKYLGAEFKPLPQSALQAFFKDSILRHQLVISEHTGYCLVESYAGPPLISIPVFHFAFYCRVIAEIPANPSDTCIGFYRSEVRQPQNLVLSIYKEDEDFFSFYPRSLTRPPDDDLVQI
jgi:hypothetical protein